MNEPLTVNVPLTVKPFMLPNFVSLVRGDCGNEVSSMPITQLPREVVAKMCEAFTVNLLAKWDKANEVLP